MRTSVDHREIAKTGVTKRASREGTGEPTEEGKIKGREVRPG
jgi:hypothetical protein